MKKILVYRMKGEKRKRLKKICGELEIDLSVVSPAEYGEAIGALVGFPGMRKQGRLSAGTGVAGEMLVFCGLDDTALEEFLVSRFFRKYSGKNFLEYVTEKRIERVCYLLKNTDLKVKTIVEQVGYLDVASFTKKFRKIMGVSPARYREMARQERKEDKG